MPKTCIIGAGLSGLALAWQKKRTGESCTVLEAGSRVGGAIRSQRQADYVAEEGPHSILINNAAIEAFLESIPGLTEQIIEARPQAKKRFIVRKGQLQPAPSSPWAALSSPLLSLAGKLRLLKEPFIGSAPKDSEESVANFARRRFGPELYHYAINPMVGGIYAGDPEQLSLRHAFPKLHTLDQQPAGIICGGLKQLRAARRAQPNQQVRKRIISFKNGMAELPNRLAAALAPQIQCNISIQSIQRKSSGWHLSWHSDQGLQTSYFDQLILTTPAHRLARLPFEQEILAAMAALQQIEYPPVSVISLSFKRADVAHPLDGFGALVPECENRKILGVLFPSSIFNGRAPSDEVLLSVFVGGARQPSLAKPKTSMVLGNVLAELEALLGITAAPTSIHHKHWPQAIPQYKLDHGQHLAHILDIERRFPGLQLAGNYRTGISVSDCIKAALV